MSLWVSLWVSRWVVAGFGLGWAPVAPGTVASAAAALAGLAILQAGPWFLATGIAVATVGGYLAIRRAAVIGDPGWVVVDEVAGQWLAMVCVPPGSVPWTIAAFVLFRVLDIAKPGPVGWADRRPGPLGIMLDDLVAGGIAAVLLGAARVVMTAR